MSGDRGSAAWLRHVGAAVLFTVVALWCNRAVLDRPGEKRLRFGVKAGPETFRHPDPIEPTTFRVTWRRGRGFEQSELVRGMLPLALAAGRTTDIAVDANIIGISHNRYDVTLSIPGDPDILIGREQILVLAKSAVPPPVRR